MDSERQKHDNKTQLVDHFSACRIYNPDPYSKATKVARTLIIDRSSLINLEPRVNEDSHLLKSTSEQANYKARDFLSLLDARLR